VPSGKSVFDTRRQSSDRYRWHFIANRVAVLLLRVQPSWRAAKHDRFMFDFAAPGGMEAAAK
jgi:hypothetical protein